MLNIFRKRPPIDIATALQQAVSLQQQGQLAEAESLYRRILEDSPRNFDALHLLGVVFLQTGRHADALRHIDDALKQQPASPQALSNRALALDALGKKLDALASLDDAVRIAPQSVEAHINRGTLLSSLGRLDEALASFGHAVALRANSAAAHAGRAAALQSSGRLEAAVLAYEEALAHDPSNADVLTNLGSALLALERPTEAIDAFDRALLRQPRSAIALNNRGNALSALERHEEAVDAYRAAIDARPDYAAAHNNLGNALHALRRNGEALAEYDLALASAPHFVEALQNRGVALRSLGRVDDALASFERALTAKPDYADAHFNRAAVLSEQKRHAEAIAACDALLAIDPDYPYALGNAAYWRGQICDWSGLDAIVQRVRAGVRLDRPVAHPFAFLGMSDDPAEQLQCSRSHVAQLDLRVGPNPAPVRKQRKKINVAYLSANYHDHPVAQLIAGLFEQHDREQFEVTGISFGPERPGEMRTRIERAFDRFIDIRSIGDADAAALLRDLDIDIAVDLMGYTNEERPGILARRAAPIQVNYLGFPGTMGADFIDYIIADQFIVPEPHRASYSEHVVCLPDTYQANDSKRRIAQRTPARDEVGLPPHAFVFSCFNNNYKITPTVFDVWMRLLEQLEGSVLWLLRSDPAAEHNLRREASARGVTQDRLVFAPKVGLEDHLARHRLADLFLDTLPYNAHTTASDALWAGLPLVTCAGSTFAGRVAGSLLGAVGLPELVTDSLGAYEALALRLATKPEELRAVRAKLASNRLTHPLFDTARFCRQIEGAYAMMHTLCVNGEGPRSFAVPADVAANPIR